MWHSDLRGQILSLTQSNLNHQLSDAECILAWTSLLLDLLEKSPFIITDTNTVRNDSKLIAFVMRIRVQRLRGINGNKRGINCNKTFVWYQLYIHVPIHPYLITEERRNRSIL